MKEQAFPEDKEDEEYITLIESDRLFETALTGGGSSSSKHDFENDAEKIFSLQEIIGNFKGMLSQQFQGFWVEAEISECHRSLTGTTYFTLKDGDFLLRCIMFSADHDALETALKPGRIYACYGHLSYYEKRGTLSFIVQQASHKQEGMLQKNFDQLKEALAAKGYFSKENKKAIPNPIMKVALISSRNGAALADFNKTLQALGDDEVSLTKKILLNSQTKDEVESWQLPVAWPLQLMFFHASVQGEKAAAEICTAITEINDWNRDKKTRHEQPMFDVIVLMRGGGSSEDLSAFNDARLLESMFHSELPIICALGHEIDRTLADYVSSQSVSTPTAAANFLFENRRAFFSRLSQTKAVLASTCQQKILSLENRWQSSAEQKQWLQRLQEKLSASAQSYDFFSQTLVTSAWAAWQQQQHRFYQANLSIQAFSPKENLQQGFALVRQQGKVITRAAKLKSGDTVSLEFHDGFKQARIL